MHEGPEPLLLPNVWDVASALAVAAHPAARALATTSAGVARSLGWEDGEEIPPERMLDAVARIAAAVELPVTADLEAGYGDAVATARAAWDVGVVGLNLEDGNGPAEAQCERIAAVRAAVPELVVNARIDVFIGGSGELDEAIERGGAYLAAGADCIYPIGLADDAAIKRLVREVGGPVNVLASKEVPPVAELVRLGVRRISVGSGLHNASLATARAGADELFEHGTYGFLP
ncbi:MAG TPA: isocitrate lyase/phosphoenolpyruvate mutase family protein [Gaiellaceae bacterium]|nr:isocitrate lyase/phosphoenolpyruvate mutase family protein [Gaiellaceae bacterium]